MEKLSKPVNLIEDISEYSDAHNYTIELPTDIPVCEFYKHTFNFDFLAHIAITGNEIINTINVNLITKSQLNIPSQILIYFRDVLQEWRMNICYQDLPIIEAICDYSIFMQFDKLGTVFKFTANTSINYEMYIYVLTQTITINFPDKPNQPNQSYLFKFKDINYALALLTLKTYNKRYIKNLRKSTINPNGIKIINKKIKNVKKLKELMEGMLNNKYLIKETPAPTPVASSSNSSPEFEK